MPTKFLTLGHLCHLTAVKVVSSASRTGTGSTCHMLTKNVSMRFCLQLVLLLTPFLSKSQQYKVFISCFNFPMPFSSSISMGL